MAGILKLDAPRVMPPLSAILADLGRPTAGEVGDFLGVDPRTVRRWRTADQAPRAVLLALFWLTRWGRSQVECQAVNDARLAAEVARSAERIAAARLAQVEHLLQVGDFGAANAPMVDGGRR